MQIMQKRRKYIIHLTIKLVKLRVMGRWFRNFRILILSLHIYICVCVCVCVCVRLKTVDCFLFKTFKWSVNFLMSESRWWRKNPLLAQALSTISLVIFRGCVTLFVAVSFIYIYFGCFFFLHHLDPDIRKITKKLERLHLKILKRR